MRGKRGHILGGVSVHTNQTESVAAFLGVTPGALRAEIKRLLKEKRVKSALRIAAEGARRDIELRREIRRIATECLAGRKVSAPTDAERMDWVSRHPASVDTDGGK